MPGDPFRLVRPALPTVPLVVASPHSGRHYDEDFLAASVLDRHRIRSSEDAFVDDLLAGVPGLGAPLLTAIYPRAWLDLNRAAEELDPAVVRDVPKTATNPRVNSGLGVIPRVVAEGRAIYEGKLSRAEAEDRIARVWHPYHAQLRDLMREAEARFGRAILIDMHSMPHEAIRSAAPRDAMPQMVLGDRFGASAGPEVVDALQDVFTGLGLRVARNAPFAGAYVTQAYGRPGRGWHAVQVEIDRALYMDEATLEPHAGFDGLCQVITEGLRRFCAILDEAPRLAAE